MASPFFEQDRKLREIALARFSFSLFQEVIRLSRPDQNVVMSPVSIIAVLTMIQAGARGRTDMQIKEALNMSDLPDEYVNMLLANLIRKYVQGEVLLWCGSEVFISNFFPLNSAYEMLMKQEFGTSPIAADFTSDMTRLGINKFVEENTHYQIREIFPPGSLNSETRLLLLNAVFFRGIWLQKFVPFETRREQFFLGTADSKMYCQMMHKTGTFRSGVLPRYDARVLELPYLAPNLSMFIILPNQIDGLGIVEAGNFQDIFLEADGSISPVENLRIAIPKFTLDFSVDMREILARHGIIDMFVENSANLSGMSPIDGLYVTDTVHTCRFEIDEEGTSGYAASGITTLGSLYPPPPFIVDHPFYYYVKNNENNAILFAGRLLNPFFLGI